MTYPPAYLTFTDADGTVIDSVDLREEAQTIIEEQEMNPYQWDALEPRERGRILAEALEGWLKSMLAGAAS